MTQEQRALVAQAFMLLRRAIDMDSDSIQLNTQDQIEVADLSRLHGPTRGFLHNLYAEHGINPIPMDKNMLMLGAQFGIYNTSDLFIRLEKTGLIKVYRKPNGRHVESISLAKKIPA